MELTRTAPPFLVALACTATALFTGCATISQGLGVSYRNHADLHADLKAAIAGPSQPVPRATQGISTKKDTFIGIAISGGGSRAANFGMAALTELDELGLLQHVDAVSAVSGGSLPAAFFALKGSEPDWQTRGKKAMGRDFLGDVLGKLFSPKNLILNTFTDQDRSDLLAEALDERLFDGRRPTFADLGDAGPRRPALYIHATDTTNRGERFVFTDDEFHSKLGSSLASYPLAWALASSGAFPAVFNSVTLRRYSLDPTKREEADPISAARHYIHLIDGGTSDNLGIDTLVDLARRHHVAHLREKQESLTFKQEQETLASKQDQESPKCMLVLVDAHVPSVAADDATRSDRRYRLPVFIDFNFFGAIDAMLTHRRFYALSSLGIRKDVAQGSFNIEIGSSLTEYDVRPYVRAGIAKIRYPEHGGRAGLPESSVPLPGEKDFHCLVWHVALQDIHAIRPWMGSSSGDGAEESRFLSPTKDSDPDRSVYGYRALLARVVEQLATSYRLGGVKGCSADFLQEALFDAAQIAVRQDKESLDQVCKWMKKNELNSGECHHTGAALVRSPFAVEPVKPPRNQTEIEQGVNRALRCVP